MNHLWEAEKVQHVLSKRAFEIEDLWQQISSVWHTNEGFCENLFRISSYLLPFVPGLGWSVFILEKIAAFFGFGLADLGAAIDRFAGWEPSNNLNIGQSEFSSVLVDFITTQSKSVNASKNLEQITKTAWFGGLIKLIQLLPRAIVPLTNAVKFMLLTFGFSKVGEIYSAVSGTTKAPGALMLENSKPQKTELLSEENISAFKDLISNPLNVVKPLTDLYKVMETK